MNVETPINFFSQFQSRGKARASIEKEIHQPLNLTYVHYPAVLVL
jgi:hypothetical protein